MNYFLHLLIYLDIYCIVAISLNILIGYCGLLTLAHAEYFALGAYTYALSTLFLHLTFFPAMLTAVCVSTVASLALSFPALRFRGDFFVLISLAVQVLLFSIFNNWSKPGVTPGTWENLTNGPFGLTGIPRPNILGIQLNNIVEIAVLYTLFACLVVVLSKLLLTSPWGRLLKAIRDDALTTRGLAKKVNLVTMQAVAFSCGLVGLAGGLYAAYINYLDPTAASLDEAILMVCMVIVGGVGSFSGPLVGAIILLLIPEMLRFAAIPDAVAANIRLLLYGLLLMVLMHLRPQGIIGKYHIK